jgi:L-lactate utilization protein LutB
VAEPNARSFIEALHGRVDVILDCCTRCGECVAACPMVEPAGIDVGNGAANAPAIVEGILDLLAGGEGTPDAERWAQVCTNSGKCIPACNYGINPRFMVNMACIAAKAKLGDAEVRCAAHRYFNTMSRGTRVISRLQLAAGGNRIRTCMGLFLSSVFLVCWRFFVRSGKAVLRPVAYDQVRRARGRGQGTETLAELSGLPLSRACVSQRLDA